MHTQPLTSYHARDKCQDYQRADRHPSAASGAAHTGGGALRETLDDKGLRTEPGRMSTYVVGEDQVAFSALQDAFGRATAWDMW